MIINLRGTNGAGKSTIVREIMKDYDTQTLLKYPMNMNKKKVMGYICARGTQRLFVVGHYEIKNGGIDTIGNLDYAYHLIYTHHEFAADVIFEGMNRTDGTQRLVDMYQRNLDIRIVFIDYPLQKCIAAVRERGHTIHEKTIRELYNKSLKQMESLKALGIPYHYLERRQALEQCRKWLKGGDDVRPASSQRQSGTGINA